MTSTPIRPVIRTGLLANRPSAGSVPAGDGYLATDAGLSVSDGTVWRDLDAISSAGLIAHSVDTTDVHGIADTAALVRTSDARLTDARSPTSHAVSHAAGATDPIAPLSIGARPLSDTRFQEHPVWVDFSDASTFASARGEWTVVTGAAPTIVGGGGSPPSSSENVFIRSAEMVCDCEVVWKITSPASVVTTGASWAAVMKYLDGNNYLMARWSNTSPHEIQLYKKDNGSFFQFGTPVPASASASTSYWLRARIVRNTFRVEWWTTEPGSGGNPTAVNSFTLVGSDATKYGAGVRGKVGFRHSSAQTWTLDDACFRPIVETALPYTARIYRNTQQTVVDNTLTVISMNTERWDDGDMWNSGAPTRLTVPVAGIWYFEGFLEWASAGGGTGSRFADLFLNNTTIIGELNSGWKPDTNAVPIHSGGAMWKCAVGDYVELRVFQNSGGSLNTLAGSATLGHKCELGAHLVRPL